MQQVLFYLPLTDGVVPPNGVPVYGFGAMLFLTFILVAMVWGPRRCETIGLPRERLQDLAIVLFLTGIAGARLLYMLQYHRQFSWNQPTRLISEFFQIWNGGIVFYGSLVGGLLGYLVFYRVVLRKLGISTRQLADAIAPLLALGLAIGRIGCYLNGCCWGQPVCLECQPAPLVETAPILGQFPLLPAHARDQVTRPPRPDDRLPHIRGLQTTTGFSLQPRQAIGEGDPRSVIAGVEPGSAAAVAGLVPGDKIIQVQGQANHILVELTGSPEQVDSASQQLAKEGGVIVRTERLSHGAVSTLVAFATVAEYQSAVQTWRNRSPQGLTLSVQDTLWELARDWPRGVNRLSLVVERGQEEVPVVFTPRTVPFYPTQLYETISMLLLIGLLLSFQPYRRHDGQVMVLFLLGYAVHRFFNESIRIEPTYAMGLTLSQWISLLIVVLAIGLEVMLRLTLPRRGTASATLTD